MTLTAVALALTFNSEQYDFDPNGAIHDTGSNTSRLTVRTAGFYLVGATVDFGSSAAGYRSLTLRVNGTTNIAADARPALADAAFLTISIATVYQFAASDYVEVLALQTSGGALNVNANGNYTPYFYIAKV